MNAENDEDHLDDDGNAFKVPIMSARREAPKFVKASLQPSPIGNSLGENSVAAAPPIVKLVAKPPSQPELPLPYNPPRWAATPNDEYYLEVLRSGSIIGNIDLSKKSFYTLGRLGCCDVVLEHPSLSRYHAVLQYSDGSHVLHKKGWYIYDLDSTHGSFVNRKQVKARTFYFLQLGFTFNFAGSSRMFILNGPAAEHAAEPEMTLTEMKQQMEEQRKEEELKKQKAKEEEERKMKAEGCSWGFGEDAKEENFPSEKNPFTLDAPSPNEHKYSADPRKALVGYFDREGVEMPEVAITEAGYGKFTAQLQLPIEDEQGVPLPVEVTHVGKKKEAVNECALEACRLLDIRGLLYQSTHESRKRKSKNWEDDDFYDSDEDTFLDRTGCIEGKRKFRMKKSGKIDEELLSYQDVIERLEQVDEKIAEVSARLNLSKQEVKDMQHSGMDELDSFMASLKNGSLDAKTRLRLKSELVLLKQDRSQLQKMAKAAKPFSIPIAPTRSSRSPLEQSPTQESPAQESSHKENPIKENPIKENPIKENPVKENHIKENPIKESSNKESPEKQSRIVEDKQPKQSHRVDSSKVESQESPGVPWARSNPTGSKPSFPGQERSPANEAESQLMAPPKTIPSHAKRKIAAGCISQLLREEKHNKVSSSQAVLPNPDYSEWVPPMGQSGDGKTHLNKKYGY